MPGSAGVPVTATAVIANITVTGSTAGSFVTAWPAGEAKPNASNLNFGPGATVANLSVVKLSNGQLSLATAVGSTHVVVDVLGYFDPATGSFFHPVAPIRILDDRIGTGFSGPLPANTIRSLGVTGTAQVPSGATGLVANLTVTNPTTGSFVTAFPTGQVRPPSSSLNFGPGQTIPNLAMTRVGADGASSFYNQTGTVDLIADVVGYYAAS